MRSEEPDRREDAESEQVDAGSHPAGTQQEQDEFRAILDAAMEQSMKELEEPPPLQIENGVDAQQVTYLKEVERQIGLGPRCETDEQGRIISVQLWGDANSPPLDEVLKRLAPLRHVRQAKIGESDLAPPPQPLTDDGFQHLNGWKELEQLEIDRATLLTGRAFARLAKKNPLKRLTLLRISRSGGKYIPYADLVLAAVKNCAELREISLPFTDLTDAGLPHLAKLVKLEELEFSDTKITGEGMRHLRTLAKLRELLIGVAANSDIGLEHLSALPRLEKLFTEGAAITDVGLAHLARLKSLTTLSLSDSSITAQGLEHLIALPDLNALYIDGTPLGDEAMSALGRMKSLRSFWASGTKITRSGAKQLQHALPHCGVVLNGEEIY